MTVYLEKPMSLLERKKQQWAKEREEIDGYFIPWESQSINSYDSDYGRSRYTTRILSLNNDNFIQQETFSRKSSLPPICNRYNEKNQEHGGETSGYVSDNNNNNQNASEYPQPPWTNQSGYESASSRDERSKWGTDIWQAKENSPPSWVKRGLEQEGQIIVSNHSPAGSPESHEYNKERPFTSSSSTKSKTYIRGQNQHLDSNELAERERKRQIALLHQEAIRQQLQERERKREEEKKRRIQEEFEEELRIARDREIERQRQEHERKILEEKQERDKKRKEALKEALENAEKEARLRKQQSKTIKTQLLLEDTFSENQKKDNEHKSLEIKEKFYEKNKTEEKINENNEQTHEKVTKTTLKLLENMEDKKDVKIEISNNNDTSSCSKELKTDHLKIYSTENNVSPSCSNDAEKSLPKVENTDKVTVSKTESIAVILQPNFDLQHFQYAVLMPTTNKIPLALPVAVQNELEENIPRTENRVLTPSQYRIKQRNTCDSSTQTEPHDFKFEMKEKSVSEISYEERTRKGRRSRSESVEDRPKWGANRPPTRYLKQSEKDLLYQRKKMRPKVGEHIAYDEKISSDESQGVTPRWRKKMEKRQRALWRKNDHQIFSRNIALSQSEIIPLDVEKDRITCHKCCCKCKCLRKHSSEQTYDILRIEHDSPSRDGLSNSKNHRLPHVVKRFETDNQTLQTLSNLHEDLIKQEAWEHSSRSSANVSSANLEH